MKLHIDCRCGCDVLVIERIKDWDIYYFNMYRSSDKGGFWYRFKNAWKYFRSGEFAYSDMTIEAKDIDRMIEFLQQAKKSIPENTNEC
jgi:hypothetical protein